MKKSLNELVAKSSVATKRRRKKVERQLFTPLARDAIAGLEDGLDIFGFTKGQFSFVDLIDAVLGIAGPSKVTVCTWTAAAADASFLGGWCKQGRIKEFRLLVDYSFLNRRGGQDAVDEIVRHFGHDAVRITRTHAKWGIISGENAEIAILTSMNLNANPRFEYFHATLDPEVVGLLAGIAQEVWDSPALADAVEMHPQQHKNKFGSIGDQEQGPDSPLDAVDFDLGLHNFDPDLS